MTTYLRVFHDYVVIVNENNDIIFMYHYEKPAVKCLPYHIKKQEFIYNMNFYNFRTNCDRGVVMIREVSDDAGADQLL